MNGELEMTAECVVVAHFEAQHLKLLPERDLLHQSMILKL
jgi:hypothetical protein